MSNQTDPEHVTAHAKRLNDWLDSEIEQPYAIETVRGNRYSLRYDLAALLAERDRLAADLAEARRQVEAACCGPWHDYETSQRDEAAFPWGRVKAARAVADQWRTYAFEHIDGVPGAQTPGWAVALTALNLVCRELDDDGMRPAADPGKPHAAPQPHAPGVWAGFADGEAAEAQEAAQRGSEGFEYEYGYQNMDRKIDKTPTMIGRTLDDILGAMQRARDFAPAVHYALRRREVGPWSTVEDENAGIAPEDEGISSADVMAQTAADEAADLRTLDQWEAHYGVRVYDPDGWRNPNDPKPWNQPLTLAEFWRRSRASTTDAVNPAWTRVAADATGYGNIILRGSEAPQHTIIVGRQEFAAFLEAAKRGEYDHLTQEQP